jgi:hypothetical protein
MVNELDAIHAEMDFRNKKETPIVLSPSDRLLFQNERYWWEHDGELFGFPVDLVWCGNLMDYLYLEFKGFGYVALTIRRT